MGKRISKILWNRFIDANPDAINDLTAVTIGIDRYSVFPNYRKYRKYDISKSNNERFGIELGTIIDWLDENTNDEYYVDIDRESNVSRNMEVIFYFHDDGDAMAFKLIVAEKT